MGGNNLIKSLVKQTKTQNPVGGRAHEIDHPSGDRKSFVHRRNNRGYKKQDIAYLERERKIRRETYVQNATYSFNVKSSCEIFLR